MYFDYPIRGRSGFDGTDGCCGKHTEAYFLVKQVEQTSRK